jgi:rhodanese-related sulfurtransferase
VSEPTYMEFMQQNVLLVCIWAGVGMALIASLFREFTAKYKGIDPQDLVLLMNRDEVQIVDVGAQNDYQSSHIQSAKHIILSQIEARGKELDKTKPVAVYCRTGLISPQAANMLKGQGFATVYLLKGGLAAWQEQHLPTSKGRK